MLQVGAQRRRRRQYPPGGGGTGGGVVNVLFREPHQDIRGVRLPNLLQEPEKACPKLHGIGGSRFVGGRIDGGSNII